MKNHTGFRHFSFAAAKNKKTPAYIRSIGHFVLTERDFYSCKYCEFGELFWCIDGKGEFLFSGKSFTLKPGYVWYYPPGSVHEFAPADKFFHYRWFTLQGFAAGALFQSAGLAPGMSYAGLCPDELFTIIEHNIGFASRQKSLHILSVGFEIICRAASADIKPPQPQDYLQHAKMMLERDFADPELNVQSVAGLLGIHRVQLSREFSRHYGVNISAYLKNLRLQKAMRMLKETHFTLAEIAGACGFSSADYLGKIVSSITGRNSTALRSADSPKKESSDLNIL